MKQFYLIVLLIYTANAFGQDSIPKRIFEWGVFKQNHLLIGYSYNYQEREKPKYHVLELGFVHSKFMHYNESADFSYYLASEFVINKHDFSIGPKIGAYVGIWGFCAGTDLVWYTNFNDGALRLVPFLGLGSEKGKIYLSFHIPITNKDYSGIHVPSIGVTFNLIPLSKKKKID